MEKGSNTRIFWAERPRQGSNREKASSASQRKTGVLVVESQEMVRGLLQTALEQQGFQTILTASGEEALEHSRRRSHPIDILLMDTALPGVDFVQTLEALRGIHPNLRCCLMTAMPGVVQAAGLSAGGALCLIAKPFRLAELLHTLRVLAGTAGELAPSEPTLPFQIYQASPPGLERRQSVRYFCQLAAHCRPLGDGTGFARAATAQNISGGGLSIASSQRFEPGKVLVVELSNATQEFTRSFLVEVIHAQLDRGPDSWSHGCAFCDPLSKETLKSLLC